MRPTIDNWRAIRSRSAAELNEESKRRRAASDAGHKERSREIAELDRKARAPIACRASTAGTIDTVAIYASRNSTVGGAR